MNRADFLPFSPPAISDLEVEAVVSAIRSGWLTRGPKTAEFEAAFSELVGAPAALATNSCTAALHLALRVHDIGPGDEVITTPMTFCATANVIEHCGAQVVLADIEPDTMNIDPSAVESAITPRTKAVIAVHYTGLPANVEALDDICRRHGIALIEDAAHALPASWNGQTIGGRSSLTCFSFYATKNLTTGEGGMLTGDPELVEKARILSLHGMSRDAWKRYDRGGTWRYDVIAPGFKYNMTDPEAAMGLVQLHRLPEMHARRKEIASRYSEAFRSMPELEVPAEPAFAGHAWHLYVLRLRLDALAIDRDRFVEALHTRGIGTSVHFIPIHLHTYYRNRYGWSPEDFPVAYDAFRRMLSLPLHPRLEDADVARVIGDVEDICAKHRLSR